MATQKVLDRLTFREKLLALLVLLALLAGLTGLFALKDSLVSASPSFVVSAAGAGEPSTTALLDVLEPYYNKLLLPLGGVLAGVMIIVAGILYASSGGEPTRISLAKELIAGAVLGLILLMGIGFVVKNLEPPSDINLGGPQGDGSSEPSPINRQID